MPSVFPKYTDVEWSMGLGVNGFSNDLNAYFALIQFAEFTTELEAGVPRPHPVFGWRRINPRTNFSLRFQFVWYEIVDSSDYESKRNSGNLYRDLNERTLQEQSCLVSHCMKANLSSIISNKLGGRFLESQLRFDGG
jgi:hypothetical protein